MPLNGATVRFRSIYTTGDSSPSMFLYYNQKDKKYKFKDHSTGMGGDAYDIASYYLQTTNYGETLKTIKNDYDKYVSEYGPYISSPKLQTSHVNKGLGCNYEVCEFSDKHYNFWSERIKMDEDILLNFNILALENFSLYSKENDLVKERYSSERGELLLGFFSNAGDLAKIYQPNRAEYKFINLEKGFYFGYDQLLWGMRTDTCLILSGPRDALVTYNLPGLLVDVICGTSESALMDSETINKIKSDYPYIFTLFDNDSTGKKGMKRYQEVYGIDYLSLKNVDNAQDISKAVDMYSPQHVARELIISLNNKRNAGNTV